MKKRVTIKDIAQEAGFSVNCVSRALMDAPDISIKTKERIKQLALEMGYIPNSAATTLRRGDSKTIGIVYDNLLNPFYSIMTNYLWNELNGCGYSFLTLIADKFIFDETLATRALSNNLDGIISFLEPTERCLELCNRHHVPIVVVGRKTSFDADCVVLDDEGGGRLVADYLYSRGYRHPVYIGESEALVCSKERAQGFKDRFFELGVTAETVFNTDCSESVYRDFVSGLISGSDLPDCIFVFNDFGAMEVLTYLRDNGLSIAVVGFDDIQNEIAMYGRITSVGYSKPDFARIAVERLMAMIDDNGIQHEITVLPDIRVIEGETA